MLNRVLENKLVDLKEFIKLYIKTRQTWLNTKTSWLYSKYVVLTKSDM